MWNKKLHKIKKNGLIFKSNNVDSLRDSMVKISKIIKRNIKNYYYDEKFFFDRFKQIIKN